LGLSAYCPLRGGESIDGGLSLALECLIGGLKLAEPIALVGEGGSEPGPTTGKHGGGDRCDEGDR
jgi:hypothetical protein